MRREYFRDVDTLLASGIPDAMIVEAKRKAKEAGAEVEEYVPPPLGTGLWSKPDPAASLSGKALAAPSAGTKSTMAQLSAMALAVINTASNPSG
jgi:hypothetical protein